MSIFNTIFTILTIIGSLGIFLFGMVLISESLQKVAGKKMRGILSAITSNDLRGVLSGATITGAIQSSSATSVMIISFVNAGLISLRRSFSLLMGANIGTTVTAWIIVILGFGKTFNISSIILPLVAVSLPLLFTGRSRQRSWAEFVFGFAILFLGLQLLKNSIPHVDQETFFVMQLQHLIHFGFFSILLFTGIGILLTVIFQSSSAMTALTFVLAIDGWLPYDMAAAMVLGENVGTTVTANMAALVGNRSAKRAAFFHFFFNISGVIWALFLIRYMITGIDLLLVKSTGHSPETDPALIPLALAIFHSGFNILNTLLFIGLLPQAENIIMKIIPESRKKEREKYYLRHIASPYLSTSELSLVQARKEISIMSDLVSRMFGMIPVLLMEKEEKTYEKLYKKIRKYEKITDRIEVEIYTYLTKVSESKLSDTGTVEVRKMLKIIHDIESIGDSCQSMAIGINKKNIGGIYFKQDVRNILNRMFELVTQALETMNDNLENPQGEAGLERAIHIEKEINDLRNDIRIHHVENMKAGRYNFETGLVFNDLINHCEKIGDHAINVSEALER
jgi:phosphate:Na+ symporter